MLLHELEQIPLVASGIFPNVQKLALADVEVLNDVWPTDIPKMKQRLSETSECYITTENNTCISYHWVQLRGRHFIQQLGHNLTLPNNHAMIYHTRVAEHARGKGINNHVLTHILSDLKSSGFEKVWIYTNVKNTANQKGLKACGFIEFTRLFSIEYYHDKFFGVTSFRFPEA